MWIRSPCIQMFPHSPVQDWPKLGVHFRDITPIFSRPPDGGSYRTFRRALQDEKLDAIAGIEPVALCLCRAGTLH